jgi:hypothetical protein
MDLRSSDRDENRRDAVVWTWRGTGEVDTALDPLRPSGSLIRNARFEVINVTWPLRRGRA